MAIKKKAFGWKNVYTRDENGQWISTFEWCLKLRKQVKKETFKEKKMRRKQRRIADAQQRQANTLPTVHKQKTSPSFKRFSLTSDSKCVRVNLRTARRGSWITQGGLCDGNGRSEA